MFVHTLNCFEFTHNTHERDITSYYQNKHYCVMCEFDENVLYAALLHT